MDLKITVHCRVGGRDKTYDLLFDQDLVTIGRHSHNDIRIPDHQVSADHARIEAEDGEPVLVDLGAPSGIEVNGERMEPGSRVLLVPGTEVRIASYRLVADRPNQKLDETTSGKTSMVAMQMVKEVLASISGHSEPPYFEVLNDRERGDRLELADEDGEWKIGREKSCDLILKHWSISRKHCHVRKVMGEVTVMDLGSKNGLAVNGTRITDATPIKPGDVLAVGHTELRYVDPASSILDSLDDASSPLTNLNDLGLDLSRSSPAQTEREEKPPRPAVRRREEPPRREVRRAPPEETSWLDNLPLYLGIALAVAAVIAAVVLLT